jgi:hypothetical protein
VRPVSPPPASQSTLRLKQPQRPRSARSRASLGVTAEGTPGRRTGCYDFRYFIKTPAARAGPPPVSAPAHPAPAAGGSVSAGHRHASGGPPPGSRGPGFPVRRASGWARTLRRDSPADGIRTLPPRHGPPFRPPADRDRLGSKTGARDGAATTALPPTGESRRGPRLGVTDDGRSPTGSAGTRAPRLRARPTPGGPDPARPDSPTTDESRTARHRNHVPTGDEHQDDEHHQEHTELTDPERHTLASRPEGQTATALASPTARPPTHRQEPLHDYRVEEVSALAQGLPTGTDVQQSGWLAQGGSFVRSPARSPGSAQGSAHCAANRSANPGNHDRDRSQLRHFELTPGAGPSMECQGIDTLRAPIRIRDHGRMSTNRRPLHTRSDDDDQAAEHHAGTRRLPAETAEPGSLLAPPEHDQVPPDRSRRRPLGGGPGAAEAAPGC